MQYPPRTPAAARVGGGQDNAQGCRWRVQSCCPQGDTAGGGRQVPVHRPRTAAAHMPERHGPLPDPRWTGDRGRNGRRRLPDVLPHRDGTGHGVRRVTCWPRTTAAIPGGGPDSDRCNAACGLDGSCLRAVLLRRKKIGHTIWVVDHVPGLPPTLSSNIGRNRPPDTGWLHAGHHTGPGGGHSPMMGRAVERNGAYVRHTTRRTACRAEGGTGGTVR